MYTAKRIASPWRVCVTMTLPLAAGLIACTAAPSQDAADVPAPGIERVTSDTQPFTLPCSSETVVTAFTPPLDGPYRVSGYGFGDRVSDHVVHTGEDLAASPGTPVHAPADGCIVVSREHSEGYGNVIVIQHELSTGEHVTTILGHLSRRDGYRMRAIGSVKQGEVVGYVGWDDENGEGGPHLHFAVKSGAFDGSYPGRAASVAGFRRPSNVVGRWNFGTTSVGWAEGRQGWTPRNATNRDGESESAWTLDPDANDPGIVSGPLGPTDGTGLDPARFNAIHLSIRSCAPGKVAQLFYRTVSDPTWDEAKSVKLAIQNDCSFHEITFDMRGEAAWRDGGGIVQLRLDPTGEGRADGADEIAIDWARAIQQ